MGKNPFCYHAKLGGGKEFANCSSLVATGTEAGHVFPFISRVIVGGRSGDLLAQSLSGCLPAAFPVFLWRF